jgi:hypothetical protein
MTGSATRGPENLTRHRRQSHVSRTQTPLPLVAWASRPRKDYSPSEQRPHNGQDARRTMGCGVGGSVSVRGGGSGSKQRRGPVRSRRPDTVLGSGVGHGDRTRSSVPVSVTDEGVSGDLVLRSTGLPSRSALVAPPFRLAALRWRVAFVVLGRSRPPPGDSTACLVAATRFSVTPFPGEPHTVLCPSKLERRRHNTVYCTPAGARFHVLRYKRIGDSLLEVGPGSPMRHRP